MIHEVNGIHIINNQAALQAALRNRDIPCKQSLVNVAAISNKIQILANYEPVYDMSKINQCGTNMV